LNNAEGQKVSPILSWNLNIFYEGSLPEGWEVRSREVRIEMAEEKKE
jgi:hypothetical protein